MCNVCNSCEVCGKFADFWQYRSLDADEYPRRKVLLCTEHYETHEVTLAEYEVIA